MAAVDVIVPLYNKEATVERTIRSILRQTFRDWNLIVVDDGSTDRGPERVRRLANPRIRLISQENRGPGAARNAGMAAGDSPYIAFLDADDEWYPWYLENAVRAIESRPVSFVGSMYYEWPGQTDMTSCWKKRGVLPGVYMIRGDEPADLIESFCFFFHVGSTLVRREAAERCDGFYQEEKCTFGEDTVFFTRLVFNEPFAVIEPAAVRHNRQDSGLSNTFERAEAPFLLEPEIILDYVPPEKKALAGRVLTRMALRTVHHLARNGYRRRAEELLRRFPQSRSFPLLYRRCRLEIVLSPVLPYWVKFKCAVGPRLRLGIKKLLWKLRMLPLPPEVESDGTRQS